MNYTKEVDLVLTTKEFLKIMERDDGKKRI